MMKKYLVCTLIVGITIFMMSSVFGQETTVGGHLKLKIFDRPAGEHNGTKDYDYVGFGLSEMILFFNVDLTENVSVELQPSWSASTGATPKFGSNIGEQATGAGDIEAHFHDWVKAVVKVMLPGLWELEFGIPKPKFSWEYGHEYFWEDEINGGKFGCNNYLGAIHDAGFEIYKNFEVGNISVPFYFYLLNGGYQFADNNNDPSLMVSLEPEIGPVRFKTSLAYGKYDNSSKNTFMKYLVGAAYRKGSFALRTEYAAGNWEKSIAGTDDAKPTGFYGKVFYRFADWGRFMLHYDYVKNNFTGFFYTAPGSEKYVTITPGFQFYISDSAVLLVQYDIADWEQKEQFGNPGQKDNLKFSRPTIGTRITF